jgi:hypothetical protein
MIAIPTTLALTSQLDVKQRLKDLETWQREYADETRYLNDRLSQLNAGNKLDLQRGNQIIRWQQRLRILQVRHPIEIAPDAVHNYGYEGLRQKLVEQFAGLSKSECQLWLNNFLFIMTPDLRALSEKLNLVRQYRRLGQQRNFLIGGASGMGKTTCLDWFAAQYPAHVEATRNHVPVIKIDAPVSNKSPKPLFQRILLEGGLTYTRADNEEDLIMKMALLFQMCGTELLIVDEIEHITRPQLRRRLLEISNLTHGLPIVCTSCHPLLWVEGDAEVAGRWNDYFELRQYIGERLRQLLVFLELLLPFTQASHLAMVQITDEKGDRTDGPAYLIEQWTGGILRDIMLLIVEASQRAIERDLPCLTLPLLKQTWKSIQSRQITNFLPDDSTGRRSSL